ncbi:hypothetical protein RHSIM_Rhsim02G0182700 [Rhododendron simsii]|uniref:Uncharacterized protein n=1 Tax=Rhododendron simsii TaxID=118357 RepID=A0A834HIN6_RHOSS|nr:hypothetical protein RHSIM_Rhsim02G0182700 [Rhododendron simsii]
MIVSNFVYLKLVRYFYCDLNVDRHVDEYTLVSRVKRVDFVLDVSTMSSILKCPVVERGHIGDDEEGNRQVNNEQGQEDIAGQRGAHLAQPQVGGDFSQQIFARFDALQVPQNQMLAEFQNFAISQNSQFDRVEYRMDHIDHAQQHYLSHYHKQDPNFKPYPPYRPPSPPR